MSLVCLVGVAVVVVNRAGWGLPPSDAEGLWHAFIVEDADGPIVSRCESSPTLPVNRVGELRAVPGGRPCLPCLLVVTDVLPTAPGWSLS